MSAEAGTAAPPTAGALPQRSTPAAAQLAHAPATTGSGAAGCAQAGGCPTTGLVVGQPDPPLAAGVALQELPDAVVVMIADALLCRAGGSPGDVLRLMATCKSAWRALCSASPLWSPQCAALGWITHQPAAPGACPAGASGFQYFRSRMQVRWTVRCTLRRYQPFLNPSSRQAFIMGATIQQLQQVETALGHALPCQLWELYRYRNGQAPGLSVEFVEGARMLMLHELCIESRDFAPVAAMAPAGGALDLATPGAADAVLGRGAQGAGATPAVLPFTTKLRGSQRFVCDWDGRVHKQVGFNRIFIADSLTTFLAFLLR